MHVCVYSAYLDTYLTMSLGFNENLGLNILPL